jgi:uncharacterized protein YneF (UPF0154 family)
MKKNHTPNHKNLLPILPTQRHTQKIAVLSFFLLFFFAGFVGKGQTVVKNLAKLGFRTDLKNIITNYKNDPNPNLQIKFKKTSTVLEGMISNIGTNSDSAYVVNLCNTLVNDTENYYASEALVALLDKIKKQCQKVEPKNETKTRQGTPTNGGQTKPVDNNNVANTNPPPATTVIAEQLPKEETETTSAQTQEISRLKVELETFKQTLELRNSTLDKLEESKGFWQLLSIILGVVGLVIGLLLGLFIPKKSNNKTEKDSKPINKPKSLTELDIQQEMKKRNLKTEETFIKELCDGLATTIPAFRTVKTKQEFLALIQNLFQKTQQTNTTKTVVEEPTTPVHVPPVYVENQPVVSIASVRYAIEIAGVGEDSFENTVNAQTIYKVEFINPNEAIFSINREAFYYAIANYSMLNSACLYTIAPNNNTQSIQTTQKGKLVNHGGMWVVKEKAVIVFK